MASAEQLKNLKILMDIELCVQKEDTTEETTTEEVLKEDAKLMLELDSAIEVTVNWFDKYACKPLEKDSDGFYIIPTSVLIGISKYIEASRLNVGVRSESIGGMSVSYGGASGVNATGTPLDDFYAFLETYRCNKISFVPMKK